MKNREIKGSGFILRVVRTQESDLIVVLLNSEGEKCTFFARAGQKSQKRFGRVLEPFVNIFYRGFQKVGTDLLYMEEASLCSDFSRSLSLDLKRLTAASYILELTESVAQSGLSYPELYNLVGAALMALAGKVSPQHSERRGFAPEGVKRHFEVKLLTLLGWWPNLEHCGVCGAREQGESFFIDPLHGQVTCANCQRTPLFLTHQMQFLVKRLLTTSLMKVETSSAEAASLESLVRALFSVHFGSKIFKSQKFDELIS